MWLSVGFVCGYLSKFLFSYILSPLLIEAARAANANIESSIFLNIANVFYANMAAFTLCFIFAIVLSYYTASTKPRLLLFVFGSIAVSLYAQIEGLIGYMGIYSELPSWAIASEMQGFISLLLIIPLFSIAGIKVGTWIKMKRKPA
jgi:hypothetical protein